MLVAGILTASFVLAGCSSSDGAPESTSASSDASAGVAVGPDGYVTPRRMPEGKGSGESDGVFPRTVVHFQGETPLDQEPKRVVVISTGQADAVLTLGVVPVGSTAGDGADLIPAYLYDAVPKAQDALDAVTSVGDRIAPDIETIANLEPDLILMNTAGKDAQSLHEALSAVAPTVATQGTGLYWKQDFLLLADALGKTEQAQRWLDTYQAEAKAFGETVTGSPTVSFLRRNGDRTRVFGVASFAGSVAEDAGLARPESQRFTDDTSVDISAEQLDQADGDWIFYGVQGGDDTEITSMPLWPTLGAVGADRAVSVDDDVFYLNVGPTAANEVLTVLESTLGS